MRRKLGRKPFKVGKYKAKVKNIEEGKV